ncbi:MAG TPA: hypothetical protein VNK43_07285 [Gemmatimonadales bacterium]|nr:hypothetical protein [Gemmatimonadales bacterium]
MTVAIPPFPAAEAERFLEALERECYHAGAGLTTHPELAAIYAAHPRLTDPDILAGAREEFLATGSRRAAARLAWLVDVAVGHRTAELEARRREWESRAVVTLPNGDRHDYHRVPVDLARIRDREHRLVLERARTTLAAAHLGELRLEAVRREREVLESLRLGDAVRARSTVSGVDLDALAAAATRFLRDTADLYEYALGRLAKRRLDLAPGRLAPGDLPWLFASHGFDRIFDGGTLAALARLQLGEMGLDAAAGGRIRIDAAERPGKGVRAFCSPVRVPDEVYVVIRPRGGHGDLRSFWHELGHALHRAHTPRDLPFETRRLGDPAVTEGYAHLLDRLTVEPGWLRRYLGLGAREADALIRELAVGDLFIRRRHAAKLLYELELYRAPDRSAIRGRYGELMSEATLARYPDDDALLDVDPGLHSARYLRGWRLEAALGAWLTGRFGDDWFRNPDAGPALAALMARGGEPRAEELARELTGREPSFEPLVRRAESLLG